MSTIQEFDYAIDLMQSLLWQYDNATNLLALVRAKQDWYTENQEQFWTDWYNQVFYLFNPVAPPDFNAFTDFGCAVWSIILGMPLQIETPVPPPNETKWGFGSLNPNWYFANFQPSGTPFQLSLPEKILILKLRYFQLTTRGAIPEVNQFLQKVFDEYGAYTGKVYALDGLNMTMRYIFTGPLSRPVQYILEHYDILPRPAGVRMRIIINPSTVWGFGPHNQNFGNGTFIQGG
jgi:hypothetical protein